MTRRRPTPAAPRRESSAWLANELLCDVLGGLSEQARLAGSGFCPVVLVFGVRFALSGSLQDGYLYPLTCAAVAGQTWMLRCRDGRLTDRGGVDVGSAFEDAAFVVLGSNRAPGRAQSAGGRRVRELLSED